MNLTGAQRTALKAHVLANTNQAINPNNGQSVGVINTLADTGDNYGSIANWYNLPALAGDNQAFTAPLTVWQFIDIQTINAAIDFSIFPPHGLGGSPTVDQVLQAQIAKLLYWQSLTWNSRVDMRDAQQRLGCVNIWGSGTATCLALGVAGKRSGSRLELLFAGAGVGGGIGLGANGARVCGKDAANQSLDGQTLTETDVRNALLNG